MRTAKRCDDCPCNSYDPAIDDNICNLKYHQSLRFIEKEFITISDNCGLKCIEFENDPLWYPETIMIEDI